MGWREEGWFSDDVLHISVSTGALEDREKLGAGAKNQEDSTSSLLNRIRYTRTSRSAKKKKILIEVSC
jgi:hypothetical protein